MIPFADLPPQLHERVVCSISAAARFDVPANIVLAVAEKEGGRPGQWVPNKNGTHDVGPMQFNTAYLAELRKYGITPQDVAGAGCYPYDLAAWRLRRHIRDDKGDLWTKAANYHSRTPEFNAIYRADLKRRAAKWADWLEARFQTVDVTAVAGAPQRAMAVQGPSGADSPTQPRTAAAAAGYARTTAYVPRRITFRTEPATSPAESGFSR